jgi:predicted transcriptional regulator
MAWTARSEDEKKEYFDSPEELEKKVSQLAEWVKESKHMIIFTVSRHRQDFRWVI